MRLKAYIPFLLIVLIAAMGQLAHAQDQNSDEDVRGAFLTSRPASSSGHPSATHRTGGSRRRPHQSTGRTTAKDGGKEADAGTANSASGGEAGGGTAKNLSSPNYGTGANGTNQPSTKTAASTSTASGAPGAPLALGYTLYMRDASGDAVRTDPAREFHNGDRVRISLETSTDSYLYVFHTENDGPPEMIFPDARLDAGDNFIEAHVPSEIPSSQEQNENLRWFSFYGQPATEHVYIVLAREPLPLVPVGDALVNYCQSNKARCPWHPPTEIWAQLLRDANGRVLVNKAKTYGQAQTAGEREATTRGFGLDQSAPAPSVIRMNASSNSPWLVTALELVHK